MRFIITKDQIADVQRTRAVESVYKILNEISPTIVVPFDDSFFKLLKKNDIVFNLAIGKRHDIIFVISSLSKSSPV